MLSGGIIWTFAALHPVHFKKKKNNCISHSHLPTFTVVHPFSSALYHIQDDVITYLNNFILLGQGNVSGAPNDRSDLNGNERRRTRVPQDYQDTSGCTLEAAATQCSLAESPRGPLLLTDMLLKKMHCGIRASVFANDPVQLHTILKLHGFVHIPDTVRECKMMLFQHLLNGDCMLYDHLCHSPENTQRPDRTACRNLSHGFSDSQELVQAVMSIVMKATARQISNDNLLVMVESIGQFQFHHPRVNLRRQLIQTLKSHSACRAHRATMNTPAFDVFHDLLVGFEQCNALTLASIMSRHRLSPPLGSKMKRDDMIMAILEHISEGHCILNSRTQLHDLSDEPRAFASEDQIGCVDVHRVVDPDSTMADEEMKVALLETLRQQLPRLPMLHLFRIQNIDHNPDDSLKSLRKKLGMHIESLKKSYENEDASDINGQEQTSADWPLKTPQSLKEKITSLFLQDTSSEALKTFTCASCGEASLTSK